MQALLRAGTLASRCRWRMQPAAQAGKQLTSSAPDDDRAYPQQALVGIGVVVLRPGTPTPDVIVVRRAKEPQK